MIGNKSISPGNFQKKEEKKNEKAPVLTARRGVPKNKSFKKQKKQKGEMIDEL